MTLVAFDFDGTLSDSEMTILLGEQCDRIELREEAVADRMGEITRRAMNDEIGYAESLRRRCALLADLPLADAEAAFAEVTLRPGATDIVARLREAGVFVTILTGGFERGVEAALEREGVAVDAIVANRLPAADGRLTGDVEGPLVEGTKDGALDDLVATSGESLTDTVAVGDGANDLPMLEATGLAVGFDPKPAVEPSCDVVVETMGELDALFEREGLY
ncbi:phosphoserine phosphatase SerB [Halobacteriales archaeon SW_10_68_16]|jgi:phosphoserine phosphatase|nr:MAG: phosphoserine phosphatase SerB [Halobacteriales archaeon SW_10_68_16]